jgi:hypothetical protein
MSQNTRLIIVIGRSADIGGDSDKQPWPFTESMEGLLYVHTLTLRQCDLHSPTAIFLISTVIIIVTALFASNHEHK